MMKEKYADVEVKTIEFIRGNAVLNALGSITDTPVVLNSENSVSIDPLKEDNEFKTSSFSDITF